VFTFLEMRSRAPPCNPVVGDRVVYSIGPSEPDLEGRVVLRDGERFKIANDNGDQVCSLELCRCYLSPGGTSMSVSSGLFLELKELAPLNLFIC